MPTLAPPPTPLIRQTAPTDSSGQLSESLLDSGSESNYDDLLGTSDVDSASVAGASVGALARRQKPAPPITIGVARHHFPARYATQQQQKLSHFTSVTKSVSKSAAKAKLVHVSSAEEIKIRRGPASIVPIDAESLATYGPGVPGSGKKTKGVNGSSSIGSSSSSLKKEFARNVSSHANADADADGREGRFTLQPSPPLSNIQSKDCTSSKTSFSATTAASVGASSLTSNHASHPSEPTASSLAGTGLSSSARLSPSSTSTSVSSYSNEHARPSTPSAATAVESSSENGAAVNCAFSLSPSRASNAARQRSNSRPNVVPAVLAATAATAAAAAPGVPPDHGISISSAASRSRRPSPSASGCADEEAGGSGAHHWGVWGQNIVVANEVDDHGLQLQMEMQMQFPATLSLPASPGRDRDASQGWQPKGGGGGMPPGGLLPSNAIKLVEEDNLSLPPLGGGKKGGFAAFSFLKQQAVAQSQLGFSSSSSVIGGSGVGGGDVSGNKPATTTNRFGFRRLVGADEMLNRLLVEQARVDSEHFPVMTLEEVQDSRRDLERLEKRIAETKRKLCVEARIRDAAIALRKSHRRAPSQSAVNTAGANTNGKAEQPQDSILTSSPPSAYSTMSNSNSPTKAPAVRGGAASASQQQSPAEREKMEEKIATATGRVESIAQTLMTLSERATAIRRALLEHHTAVLSQRLDHLEEEQESTLVDSDGASLAGGENAAAIGAVAVAAAAATSASTSMPRQEQGHPRAATPAPLQLHPQRASLDLALRVAKERAEAIEQELEQEKQRSTRLQLQLDEGAAANKNRSSKQLEEVEKLKAELQQARQTSESLQKELDQARLLVELHRSNLEARDTSERQAKSEATALQHQVEALKQQRQQQQQTRERSASTVADSSAEVKSLLEQLAKLKTDLTAAVRDKAGLSARIDSADRSAAEAETRAFKAEASADVHRNEAEEASRTLKHERSRIEDTLRALQKEQLRADTAEHTLDELRRTHEDMSCLHADLRREALAHQATIASLRERAESAEHSLAASEQQRSMGIGKERELLDVQEALRKAERLATAQVEGLKGEQRAHEVTKNLLLEHIELGKVHLSRAEIAERDHAAAEDRASNAEHEAVMHAKSAEDRTVKLKAETKRANESEQQLRQLELAVTAERRLMAERESLFHAFERRLESAEARLREEDKRCAKLLGKLDGREEMDNLLEQIKMGAVGRKERSTAGQNIDSLITSVSEHITDLVDELRRLGGAEADEDESGVVTRLRARTDMHNADMERKVQDLLAAARESQRLIDEREATAAAAQKEVTTLQGRTADLETKHISLEAELESLRKKLSEHVIIAESLNTAQSEAQCTSASSADADELRAEIAKLELTNKELSAKERSLLDQIDHLQEDLTASKAFISDLHKRQSESSASPRKFTSNNAKALEEMAAKLAASQTEADAAQDAIALLKGEVAALKAHTERLAGEREESQRILEAAREEVSLAKGAGTPELAAQKYILELRTRCSQLTTDFANAQVALDAAKQELAHERAQQRNIAREESRAKPAAGPSSPVEAPNGESLQTLATLFPSAVLQGEVQNIDSPLKPAASNRSATTATPKPAGLKQIGNLAKLRAQFEQPASSLSAISTSPVKSRNASGAFSASASSPSVEPSITLDWAKVADEIISLRAVVDELKLKSGDWDDEKQRLLAQLAAMKDAHASAQDLLEEAQKTHELELASSSARVQALENKTLDLQQQLAAANDAISHQDVSAAEPKATELPSVQEAREKLEAELASMTEAYQLAQGPLAEAKKTRDFGSTSVSRLELDERIRDLEKQVADAVSINVLQQGSDAKVATTLNVLPSPSRGNSPRVSPMRKSFKLQAVPGTAKSGMAQTITIPTEVPSPVGGVSPALPAKALPHAPVSQPRPLRTMTLGMDSKQLAQLVRDLEDEVLRLSAARPTMDTSPSELIAELEEALEEAKDELLAAREELDELKMVQTKQRIQLLDEMNTLQEELACVRAKLRLEQRRRMRDPFGTSPISSNATLAP
ncbi:hypothetical protein K437DRAFT_265872 [Tilletiaria anomala UBC 951]|uniref:Up-regulated during septation protein 1 domain-containing protein n=1 Tax=Tilletiaria anomala (strain ATCC 24038 / CBS 436.72 / UBC 951) TaxID=1037660 RepID=A0A066WHA6_TILAU|nr:uncharacterized protein K437DRAFT_265872 [Tilletiaria anomala UBC 951]KDN53211.1 hypothetical protein K437DRAFT_265872 [Tilletiaria anomala UBC 951]